MPCGPRPLSLITNLRDDEESLFSIMRILSPKGAGVRLLPQCSYLLQEVDTRCDILFLRSSKINGQFVSHMVHDINSC